MVRGLAVSSRSSPGLPPADELLQQLLKGNELTALCRVCMKRYCWCQPNTVFLFRQPSVCDLLLRQMSGQRRLPSIYVPLHLRSTQSTTEAVLLLLGQTIAYTQRKLLNVAYCSFIVMKYNFLCLSRFLSGNYCRKLLNYKNSGTEQGCISAPWALCFKKQKTFLSY